jgi:hypothetical protein
MGRANRPKPLFFRCIISGAGIHFAARAIGASRWKNSRFFN